MEDSASNPSSFLDVVAALKAYSSTAHEPCFAPQQLALRVDTTPRDLELIDTDGEETAEAVAQHLPEAGCFLPDGPLFRDCSKLLVDLEALAARGSAVLSSIYTYKSLSGALHKVSFDGSNREAFEKQLPALEEGVAFLHEMRFFRDTAVKQIALSVSEIVEDGAVRPGTDQVLDALAVLVVQLFTLDVLKESRASLTLDFDTYKKALRVLGEPSRSFHDSSADMHLQAFFATDWCCLNTLADGLGETSGSPVALAHMAKHVYRSVKSQLKASLAVLPRLHFARLGSLAPLLFLLFGREPCGEKAAAPPAMELLGRSKLLKCLKLLRRRVVLPGIGDLVLQPGQVLALSPYLQQAAQEAKEFKVPVLSQMDARAISEVAQEHSASAQIGKIAKEHFEVASAFAALQVGARGQALGGAVSAQDCRVAAAVMVRLMAAMCRWAILLAEVHAWKTALAQTALGAGAEPSKGTGQAVAGNYSREELIATTEAITCIKGLAGCLDRSLGWLQPLMNRVMRMQAQEFSAKTIGHMIKPGSKSGVKAMLLQLRGVLAFWPDGAAPQTRSSKSKGFMRQLTKKLEHAKRFDMRRASSAHMLPAPMGQAEGPGAGPDAGHSPPSRAQAVVAQQLLEQLLAAGESAGKRSFLNSVDLSAISLKELATFLQEVRHWQMMSDLQESVQQACDLSDLWLREQTSEGSQHASGSASGALAPNGLGFSLLSAALSRQGAPEAVLAPLHVLNDAGRRALAGFQVQHLYENVREETSHLLEVMVKAVGEHIFSNAKASAALSLCDRALIGGGPPSAVFGEAAVPRRFEALLELRQLPVLGRAVDLRRLLGARVRELLRANAEHLIARFEDSSVLAVVELESQVSVLERAHAELRGLVALDDWHMFWRLMDAPSRDPSSGDVPHSRIAKHAADELEGSIIPSFILVAGLHRLANPEPGRKAPPQTPPPELSSFLLSRHGSADSASHQRFAAAHTAWLGTAHMTALHSLIGDEGISWLLGRVKERALHLLKYVLPSGIRVFVEVMAKQMDQASLSRGNPVPGAAASVYSFYRSQLQNVLGYKALRQELLQGLAELGNCVMVVQLADSALQLSGRQQFMQGAPMFGVFPRAASGLARGAAPEEGAPANPLEAIFGQMSGGVDREGSSRGAAPWTDSAARRCDHAAKQFWEGALPFSVLPKWLKSLEEAAVQCAGPSALAASAEGEPRGGAVAFRHVASALLFLLADEMRVGPAGASMQDSSSCSSGLRSPMLLGEGLHWGSAVLLCLLGEERKWSLEDLSQTVVRAAELTERKGGRLRNEKRHSQQSAEASGERLEPFLRNARAFGVSMSNAVRAIKTALPQSSPKPIFLPHWTAIHDTASQRQVSFFPDEPLEIPNLETEPVPKVKLDLSRLCVKGSEEEETQESSAEDPPPSPSDSLASVTTKRSLSSVPTEDDRAMVDLPKPRFDDPTQKAPARPTLDEPFFLTSSGGAIVKGSFVSSPRYFVERNRNNEKLEKSEEIRSGELFAEGQVSAVQGNTLHETQKISYETSETSPEGTVHPSTERRKRAPPPPPQNLFSSSTSPSEQ
mmetsp:Transcript_32954/g.78206  ORF Transcript_32954/g.78206 Transcript_32954/m.78206 type:complete len:1567 (+) Transcript_32954:248-4948(+)